MNFIEVQSFGLNLLTLGFLGTLYFTIFQAKSLIKQYKDIPLENGKSLNFSWVVSAIPLFMLFLIYGIATGQLSNVINGALFLLFIPMSFRLGKYKKFGLAEAFATLIFTALTVLVLIVKNKEVVASVALFLRLPVYTLLPIEIRRNRDRGVVEIEMLRVFRNANAFWTLYFFSAGDALLMTNSILFVIINIIAIYLWKKYP